MKVWVVVSVVLVAFFLAVLALSMLKDGRELDGDALGLLAYGVAPANLSDADAAEALMLWSYREVPGVCVEKSFMFERLANARGLTTRHIAFRDGAGNDTALPPSHAASQVLINGSWVFYDAYFGKVMQDEDYAALGFGDELVHLNCVDGGCTNWSRLSYTGETFTHIRFLRKA